MDINDRFIREAYEANFGPLNPPTFTPRFTRNPFQHSEIQHTEYTTHDTHSTTTPFHLRDQQSATFHIVTSSITHIKLILEKNTIIHEIAHQNIPEHPRYIDANTYTHQHRVHGIHTTTTGTYTHIITLANTNASHLTIYTRHRQQIQHKNNILTIQIPHYSIIDHITIAPLTERYLYINQQF